MHLVLVIVLVFVNIGLLYCATVTPDPCIDGNFEFLHTPGLRGGACMKQSGKVICDHFIRDGWYKVQHEDDPAPRKMLEGRVSPNYCGTSSPIWLNGSHPAVVDGIVNRSVCVLGIHGYCDEVYDIQIKACNIGSYVYYLRQTPSCNQGYCFGVNLPCAKPNPCEPGNRQILHAGGDRSTSCQDKDMALCDDFMNNVWYRVQRNGKDLKMPTTCVTQHSCGTVYPIWLGGSEPAVPDKVVSRKVCVNTGNTCRCDKFYNINIRNCSTYLVYNLMSTTSCPERYCFGQEGKCDEKGRKDELHFLKYVYGSVAAVFLMLVLVSIGAYMWYRKVLRLRKINTDGEMSEKPGTKSLEMKETVHKT